MTTATAATLQTINNSQSWFKWVESHGSITDQFSEFDIVPVHRADFVGYEIYQMQNFKASAPSVQEASNLCFQLLNIQ